MQLNTYPKQYCYFNLGTNKLMSQKESLADNTPSHPHPPQKKESHANNITPTPTPTQKVSESQISESRRKKGVPLNLSHYIRGQLHVEINSLKS